MIRIIAAVSSDYAIGNGDDLIFHIKEDMEHFKNHTKNQIAIFGRKTFQSIVKMRGGKLENRINVILTKNKKYTSQYGEFVFNDIDGILKSIKTMGENDKNVYVCGGSEIYKLFLPYADEVILTHVDKHAEVATNYYPMELQQSLGFIPVESETYYSDKYDCEYSFVTYKKGDSLLDTNGN